MDFLLHYLSCLFQLRYIIKVFYHKHAPYATYLYILNNVVNYFHTFLRSMIKLGPIS